MKLIQALLCPQCNEVFSSKAGKICPSCTNRCVVLLSTLIWRKENDHDKPNLPKANPKRSIFAATTDCQYFDGHSKIVDEYYRRFPAGKQAAVAKDCGVEPSKPWPRESDNKGREQLESKSSFIERGRGADAGNAFIGKIIRFFKRESEVSRNKHNRRNNHTQTLSTDKPQLTDSVT